MSGAAPNLLRSLHVFGGGDTAAVSAVAAAAAAAAAATPGDALSSNNEENVRHDLTLCGESTVHIDLAEGR